MSNTSRTDWAKVDAMSDEEIDTSDIPPLSEEFFAKAQLRMPILRVAASSHLRVFFDQGVDYRHFKHELGEAP